jgi:hypothetical protein
METLLNDLRAYLKQALQLEIPPPRQWDAASVLPRHLTDTYRFYRTQLLDAPCLLMMLHVDDAQAAPHTPLELQKHIRLIEAKANLAVLYVQPNISAGERQRLIGKHIAFAVPGRQLFLPPLGLDLREHYAAQTAPQRQALSPSAQVTLLGALLGLWPTAISAQATAKATAQATAKTTASKLASRIGYSEMTISRIRRELQAHALWGLPALSETAWRQAQPCLQSPVRRKVWLVDPPQATLQYPLAGLCALAARTMLSAPQHDIRAVHELAWVDFKKAHPALREKREFVPDALELELWKYDPMLLIVGFDHGKEAARTGNRQPDKHPSCVDPYSLYLSLQGDPDERIALSLDDMIKDAIP